MIKRILNKKMSTNASTQKNEIAECIQNSKPILKDSLTFFLRFVPLVIILYLHIASAGGFPFPVGITAGGPIHLRDSTWFN